MTTKNQVRITKDVANKKIKVVKNFNSPVEQVWNAWTKSELLDSWWAPKPWRAETKKMDFREGGMWLYCMVGPDDSRQWCRVDYQTIDAKKYFTAKDAFCDENGNAVPGFPSMHWKNQFIKTDSGTTVEVEITFAAEEDMQKILEMGFEEGFTMGLGNLEELLAR